MREGPPAGFGIVQTIMTAPGTDDAEGGVRLSVADIPAGQEPGSEAGLLAAGFATVTSITSVSESTDRAIPPAP